MTSDDPLDGADIGETVAISETQDIWLGQLESEHAKGSDRLSERNIEDVEVVTDDFGEQVLRVTVGSDVTKRLPRRWDYASEPRTESERQKQRRKTWKRRFVSIAINLGVVTAAVGIAVRMMNGLSGDVTVNGEPLALEPIQMLPGIVLVYLIAMLIILGSRGWLPRSRPEVGR